MSNSRSAAEEHEALRKAGARTIASSMTWFLTEYPKLIFQSAGNGSFSQTYAIFQKTPLRSHLRGSFSSAAQRGSSACIMFYGQYYIANLLNKPTEYVAVNAGIAGFVSGGASSLIHTVFEPMKIRHGEGFRLPVYTKALVPMFFRHALFDMYFFTSISVLQDYTSSPAIQFAMSALGASIVNLPHDLWKTQLIQSLPARVKFITVLRSLTLKEYSRQMFMKSADLGMNWGMTGFLYSQIWKKSEQSK